MEELLEVLVLLELPLDELFRLLLELEELELLLDERKRCSEDGVDLVIGRLLISSAHL